MKITLIRKYGACNYSLICIFAVKRLTRIEASPSKTPDLGSGLEKLKTGIWGLFWPVLKK